MRKRAMRAPRPPNPAPYCADGRQGPALNPSPASEASAGRVASGASRVGGICVRNRSRRQLRMPPTPDPSPPFAARMGGGERRGPSRGDESRGPSNGEHSPGLLLALAYPDRIARSRGAGGAFLLANGRGANVDEASALAREQYLAVGEIAGTAAQGRILLAAALTLAEIEAHFGDRIEHRDEIVFDEQSG